MSRMASRAVTWSLRPIEFVAFWIAIALPFLYLPLLWSGLVADYLDAFLILLAMNVVALVVGHRYDGSRFGPRGIQSDE